MATLGFEIRSDSALVAIQRLDTMTASAVKTENGAKTLGAATAQASAGPRQLAGAAEAAAMNLAKTSAAANRVVGDTRNLSFQLIDIAQGIPLAFQSPTYALQNFGYQLAQISQIYMGNGGLKAAFRDVTALVGGFAAKMLPAAAAGGALWAAWELVNFHLKQSSNTISATTRALADQAAPVDSIKGKIGELQSIVDTYARAITATADAQDIATASIIANSEREFNAKRSLLELELKRQQAAIETQKAEIAIAGRQLQRDVAAGTPTGIIDPVGGGYADPKIGQFVRAPYQDNLMQRTNEIIAGSQFGDKLKEMRANLELSEIATGSLQEALKTTFDDASDKSITGLTDKAARSARRLNDEYSHLKDDGIDGLVRKAQEAADAISNNLADGVMSLWTAFRSGENVLDSLLDKLGSIGDQMLSAGLQQLFKSALGGFGGGGWNIPTGFAPGGFFPGLASGGLVRGPGTGTSDSIPAMLSNGEYVVNAGATAAFRPLLDAINGGVAKFATGGFVRPADDGTEFNGKAPIIA